MSAKILWVNEEYDGPMNGIAEYDGTKTWFVRLNTPSIITSHIIVSTIGNGGSDRLYQLFKIDEDSMKTLEDNHIRYCEETGAPLNHGDSRKTKHTRQKSTVESEVVLKQKPSEMKKFIHDLPRNVQSEYITTIRESEFSNYLVSHRLEFI